KSRHSAEWTGDQVQLVLNDEIGRVERPAIVELAPVPGLGGPEEPYAFLVAVHLAEEGPGSPFPWKAGKFVNGRDQECGQPLVNRIIDGQDWQRPISRKVTGRIDTTDHHIIRRVVVWHTCKRLRCERSPTPWARFQ